MTSASNPLKLETSQLRCNSHDYLLTGSRLICLKFSWYNVCLNGGYGCRYTHNWIRITKMQLVAWYIAVTEMASNVVLFCKYTTCPIPPKYLRQGKVIASHSKLLDIMIYTCIRCQSPYIFNIQKWVIMFGYYRYQIRCFIISFIDFMYVLYCLLESIKTTSMENVTTGVLEK